MEEEKKKKRMEGGLGLGLGLGLGFWAWAIGSVVVRVALIYSPLSLTLSSRPEVSTPLTSLRRVAEGYWLKQSSMSPYAGSMYHGSPLLLSLLGPLVVKRIKGQPENLLCSLLFVIADLIGAMLIRKNGQYLEKAYRRSLQELNIVLHSKNVLPSGDIAALAYLWNPFTIVACVGSSTSPVENLSVMLTLYGACTGVVPLAAFGWVIATHLSLYPAILIIPVIILLGRGLDAPPRKLFLLPRNEKVGDSEPGETAHDDVNFNQSKPQPFVPWRVVVYFLLWTLVWSACLLALCSMCLKDYSHLWEMLQRTYGFTLAVEDLSPNIGVLWYFYAEAFEFFRNFFLIVFHVNVLFMVLPLAIRLNHRPLFLSFVYIAISSMLKSYPSVGDSALYLGLLALFRDQLAEMQFSFFLCCGYVGLSLLSPVMHNLWIWRGTGNANFYFGTALGYALLQIILVAQSVSTMLNHDRKIRKLVQVNRPGSKS